MNCTKVECLCVNNDTKTIYTVNILNSSVCPKCRVVTTNNIKQCFYTVGNPYAYVYVIRVCGHCGEATFHKYTIYNANEITDCFIDLSKNYYTEYPSSKKPFLFSNEISQISSKFCKIYQQAETAEKEECDEICGMGYRKALEFLVKDYLIYKKPDLKDKISKEFLATSINRIEDSRVKLLAQRSAWLGNDECHYARKHEDYNIKDLKLFISALVHFIESELIFEKANTLPAYK